MAVGNLFVGLVKGLGGSLGSAYARKQQQDYQTKQDEMHLAMNALMNDNNMPGSAKRLGLLKVFQIAGVKPPEGLIESLVPDYQTESGQYYAEDAPQINTTTPDLQDPGLLSQMPQAPQGLNLPPSRTHTSQMGPPPGTQPQQQPQQSGQGFRSVGGGLPPMPRNPLIDPPQIVSTEQNSAAPITQQYTGGVGSTSDELDVKLQDKLRELRHGRPIMKSSLDMSPTQMLDIRNARMQEDEQRRRLEAFKVEESTRQANARSNFDYENNARLGMIPKELGAKITAMEQQLGRPLTSDERAKVLGLNPTGEELSNQLEAQDIADSRDQSLPPAKRAAAQQRVLQRHLDIEAKIAQIRNINAETIKRMRDDSPSGNLTPAQVNTVIKRSKIQANLEWGQSEKDAYRAQRAQYWAQWFDQAAQGTQFPGGDQELQQMLSAVKTNPQAKANAIAQRVEKDVQAQQENIGNAIAQAYLDNPGKLVYTISAIRRAAASVKERGGDPNKIWDAMKSNPNVVILGDDLQPWVP